LTDFAAQGIHGGMNDTALLDDLDSPESTGDSVTDALSRAHNATELLMQLESDKKKGMRTRELMDKYNLSWPQIRPLLEGITTPAVRAAQKIRMATIAQDTTEAMLEKAADSVKLMDFDKLPGAIKSMLDVSNSLSGAPSQVIEVRHSAVAPEVRESELAMLRAKHKELSENVLEGEFIIGDPLDEY